MFSKTESVEEFKSLWGSFPVVGTQVTFGRILIEAKSIGSDGMVKWEEQSFDALLSDKAQAFIAKSPTHLATVAGLNFYEDPTLGDESALLYISKDGKIKRSDFWEVPSLDDVQDAGLLN